MDRALAAGKERAPILNLHSARVAQLGAVSEPAWKSCLGVLAFVENGRAISHEYSRGDPRYDPAETDNPQSAATA